MSKVLWTAILVTLVVGNSSADEDTEAPTHFTEAVHSNNPLSSAPTPANPPHANPETSISPWSGQQTIEAETDEIVYWEPTVEFDALGKAWVFWMSRRKGDTWSESRTRFHYCSLENGVWSPVRIVGNTGWTNNYRLHFTTSGNGELWLVWSRSWHKENFGQIHDIFFEHGDGDSWSAPARVDTADNNRQDFAPRIAMGGGEAWITWWGAEGWVSNHGPYRVYVSHWNGSNWDKTEELTAGMPGDHWFSDIAVGPDGTVHVVWQGLSDYLIYYRKRPRNGTWSSPIVINPLLLGVAAGGWSAPNIDLDSSGNLHIVWVGQRIGEGGVLEDWDIYYSMYDGQHVLSPQQVNPDNDDTDSYPQIRALGPEDLWIAWEAGDPTSSSLDGGTMAVRWNGRAIVEKERLDDGSFPYNSSPRMALSPEGNPLVVWGTIGPGYSPGEIVYNYRGFDPTSVYLTDFEGRSGPNSVELSWWAVPGHFSKFRIQEEREGGFETVDDVMPSGIGEFTWTDYRRPGRYTFRVKALRVDDNANLLGPITLEVGGWPATFSLRLLDPNPGHRFTLSVGVPVACSVRFALFDVQGRKLPWESEEHLDPGWSTVTLSLDAIRGRLPQGLFLLRAKTASEMRSIKLLYLDH